MNLFDGIVAAMSAHYSPAQVSAVLIVLAIFIVLLGAEVVVRAVSVARRYRKPPAQSHPQQYNSEA